MKHHFGTWNWSFRMLNSKELKKHRVYYPNLYDVGK